MSFSKQELNKILDNFSKITILVVGDIMLDRYIWGKADRISAEAPVPVVAINRTEDRLGGAGNVVSNLLELGAQVKLAGFIGDDLAGEELLSLVKSDRVASDAIIVAKGRPTTLKTRVVAQGQQVVRIDNEDASEYSLPLREALAAAVSAQVDACQAIVVSDYGKGAISAKLWERLVKIEEGQSKLPLVLDPHPNSYSFYHDIPVVKPNRKESEKAVGFAIDSVEKAFEAAAILQSKWAADTVIITLGEDGMIISSKSTGLKLHAPTRAREVYDVSGAGDTVTAVYTAAIASGATMEVAGTLANMAAGIVVAEVGTVPIRMAQLRAAIDTLE